MTLKEIGDECYLIMVAGSDTTAAALRFLFRTILAPSNAPILAKLHAELSSASLSHPVPAYDELLKLPYLQAVLTETLRLGSVPLYLPRIVSAPGFECEGLFVPGGSTVAMTPWVVSRDKSVYGEDAEVFKPERWLVSEEEKWRLQRFDFSFGFGSRACLGRNIAIMELNKVVASLMLGFEMRLRTEEEGVEYGNRIRNLSIFVEDGLWVDFKLREGMKERWADVLGEAVKV